MKLPERQAVLTSLLAYDLVGFQTQRDRRNFIQCVRMLMQERAGAGGGPPARGQAGGSRDAGGQLPHRHRRGGFRHSSRGARGARSSCEPSAARFDGRQIVLGVDRLDYTKGIPHRLRAFADLLERFPEVRGRIHLFQVVVPSRVGIPKYDELKMEIERLVGEINGRYSEMGWVPVHYFFRSVSPDRAAGLLPRGRASP